ncbi:MAG: proton-conducting transporter transmembrane domain-containing protein [Thermoleophilia bacterium]
MALIILLAAPLLAALASLAVAALASLAVRKKIAILELIAAITAPIEFAAVVVIATGVYRNGRNDLGSYLSADALGCVVLLTIGLVGLTAAFYSIGYLREEVRKEIIGFSRVRQYWVLFHLFLMAMFFAVVTVSPIMMWIAIEATTLSTAFLISFYNKASSMEAAWKYLIINSIGLLLGFFGTLLFLTPEQGSGMEKFIDWGALAESASSMNPSLVKIAFIFVLIGYGTKVGLAPMHTWLPDAHSKAPSPISALLSGSLLNVAMMAILKFRIVADSALSPSFTRNLMIYFGVASIAIPAFIIVVQKNYKRLFAYSSIEHMGIISLGLGFGGIGAFGALLHMIYHSMVKSVLFFTAGNLLLKYGSTKILRIKGVLSVLPVTGVVLVAGFLAITGMPPFGIFLTEFYILTAGVNDHLPVVIVVLFLLLLVFAGFLKHIVSMVYNSDAAEVAAGGSVPLEETGESNYLTLVPPVLLLLLFIIGGFYLPAPVRSLIDSAVTMING